MIEGGVTVGTPVEGHGLETTVGPAEGVDVGVAAEGIRLGIEVGAVEDVVVGGSTGLGVLEVEGIAAGGVLDTTGTLKAGEFAAVGVVEEIGTLSGPLTSGALSTAYTGAISSHGSVGHTAVTRAQWVKRMHMMPNGSWVGNRMPPLGVGVFELGGRWGTG